MTAMQGEDLHWGMHAIMFLAHSQGPSLGIDIEAMLDACRVVELWILEDRFRGIGVLD